MRGNAKEVGNVQRQGDVAGKWGKQVSVYHKSVINWLEQVW